MVSGPSICANRFATTLMPLSCCNLPVHGYHISTLLHPPHHPPKPAAQYYHIRTCKALRSALKECPTSRVSGPSICTNRCTTPLTPSSCCNLPVHGYQISTLHQHPPTQPHQNNCQVISNLHLQGSQISTEGMPDQYGVWPQHLCQQLRHVLAPGLDPFELLLGDACDVGAQVEGFPGRLDQLLRAASSGGAV